MLYRVEPLENELTGGQGDIYKVSSLIADNKIGERLFFAMKAPKIQKQVTALTRELKVYFTINPSLSPHLALLSDAVRHPHHRDIPLLVTEWADGGSLTKWLENECARRRQRRGLLESKSGACSDITNTPDHTSPVVVEPNTPPLGWTGECVGKCGFYGTAKQAGYCSKCYKSRKNPVQPRSKHKMVMPQSKDEVAIFLWKAFGHAYSHSLLMENGVREGLECFTFGCSNECRLELEGFCVVCFRVVNNLPADAPTDIFFAGLKTLEVALQLLRGLRSLHELGLVHQDVKPANLLLFKETGPRLQLPLMKLADFGLVGAGASGTPLYMSPEQAAAFLTRGKFRGKIIKMTASVDIWAFGLVLVETVGSVYSEALWQAWQCYKSAILVAFKQARHACQKKAPVTFAIVIASEVNKLLSCVREELSMKASEIRSKACATVWNCVMEVIELCLTGASAASVCVLYTIVVIMIIKCEFSVFNDNF